jgi:hypothetical protein
VQQGQALRIVAQEVFARLSADGTLSITGTGCRRHAGNHFANHRPARAAQQQRAHLRRRKRPHPRDLDQGRQRCDRLVGIRLPGSCDAGDGDDLVLCGSSSDTVTGGNGNDRIVGGDGADVLAGNAQADRIDGGLGKDLLNGHGGRDKLSGGGANDTLKAAPRATSSPAAAGRICAWAKAATTASPAAWARATSSPAARAMTC